MMRALKISIAVMTVLIIAGVVVLVVTIGSRLSGPKLAALPPLLDEPAGTRIAQISAAGDRLTLLLQGGGPDRVLILDLRQGGTTTRIGLAR